ncbi:SH3 and cysteine-rich domain-containing protein isoform X4 [Zootermopsis nevadensis]|uniref:SH3 and cysteine-rich domain-containing protein isoform X4 n=1 Tax=Zootermopsis nevadensis TaxID=136037 RepID=UPI000B8EB2B0|nr:SH3 and cysteine-rich domain-containing protein isoform X4 [Zootermopsis nevadensis]
MQLLVANFRKRNAELRKERPACPSALFHTWETLLQEVEIDSQAHSDIASILGRQVSRPLVERSFHRKIQSRKVFTHRESYETILTKTEDKLAKCRQDYKNAYVSYLMGPTTASLSNYFDAHNAYVQQLHAANGMLDQYHQETLPQLLQELEDVYSDLCSTLSESVLQGAEIISARALEQSRRYDGLSSQCRAVAGPTDLAHFVRSLPTPQHNPHHPSLRHNFVAPSPEAPDGTGGAAGEPLANDSPVNPPPPLKNEVVVDRLASITVRSRYDALKKEASELESQIKQLHDALDTLLRIQQRSLESSLYNKANELQEDISMKRFDMRVAQIHLGAVRAQKELFASKVESASDSSRERKMSSSSTGSMKNKWLKAFKSLKTTSTPSNGAANKDGEKKNQMYHAVSTIMTLRKNGKDREGVFQAGGSLDPAAHTFQEYTYKKITPCDICSQVLRGHTRQGLKCRVCKLNVHVDCQDKVGRCQPKSRLLRRQKSTSEIETHVRDALPDEETPHSPRKQKLNLRMKSLSLDSPESTEHAQRRRHAAQSTCVDPQSSQSSSRIQSPSSPVHNRRLLSARNMRMSSVELPDENEKSLSSASTSPCPSPKPHRLLPTNLYVVLYNFKSRHPDELDLKAGYKVTVIDTSDQDWWKGKCLGRIGYFPSKYVIKLQPGEKPLQVTHNLQVSDGDNGLMLLRDQIVIQVGEELDGMVMIRSGDNRQGVCPLKFLQEV